jgi:hypothetical protein
MYTSSKKVCNSRLLLGANLAVLSVPHDAGEIELREGGQVGKRRYDKKLSAQKCLLPNEFINLCLLVFGCLPPQAPNFFS